VRGTITKRLVLSADHPVLRGHRVQGHHLLPGLAYIDLLLQAFRNEGHDPGEIVLERISLLRALVVPDGRPLTVRLTCTPGEPETWQVLVADDQPDGAGKAYLKGMARRIERSVPQERLDLDALRRSWRRVADPEQIYATCRRHGLVHDAFMQVCGAVYADDTGIWVECSVSPQAEAIATQILCHPALLDGAALSAGGVLALSGELATPELHLPVYYGGFHASSALRRSCVARLNRSTVTIRGELRHCTIDFFDAAGVRAARLEDLAVKRLRSAHDLVSGAGGGPATTAVARARLSSARSQEHGPAATIIEILQEALGASLQQAPATIDPDAEYYELGFDSAGLLELAAVVGNRLGLELSPVTLFEHPTVRDLARHLAESEVGNIDGGRRAADRSIIVTRQLPDASGRHQPANAASETLPALAHAEEGSRLRHLLCVIDGAASNAAERLADERHRFYLRAKLPGAIVRSLKSDAREAAHRLADYRAALLEEALRQLLLLAEGERLIVQLIVPAAAEDPLTLQCLTQLRGACPTGAALHFQVVATDSDDTPATLVAKLSLGSAELHSARQART
jgi:acyl carrier protein